MSQGTRLVRHLSWISSGKCVFSSEVPLNVISSAHFCQAQTPSEKTLNDFVRYCFLDEVILEGHEVTGAGYK